MTRAVIASTGRYFPSRVVPNSYFYEDLGLDTTEEWIRFGQEVNTPLCPVNDVKSIVRDPQFQARLTMRPYQEAGTDLMPSPIKLLGEDLPVPEKAAREPGRDTEDVLRDVLGYDAARIERLRAAGALG